MSAFHMATNPPQEPPLGAVAYDEIFASSAVGVALWRDEGLIAHANATMAELVGVADPNALRGVALSSCFTEMYRPRVSDSLSRAVRAHTSSVVEAEVPHGRDNRLLLVATIAATKLAGGISLMIDLTASLTALALASSSADNTAAVNRLNAALAHEINNPLAYAMGNLTFAIESLQAMGERTPDLSTVVLALRDALEGAERVRRTVRELRLSARRASLTPAPNDARHDDPTMPPPGPEALSDEPELDADVPSEEVTPQRRGRILVVDDEPRIGSAIARVLTPVHEVAAVYTARDALLRLEAGEAFDVILCDVMMPDVSGGDLFRAITSSLPHLAAKVVFMTGGPFSGRGMAFLDAFPNRRLEKPFSPDSLRRAIQSVLSGQA